ncbi:hypothetical protein WMF28_35195 [Sorangium sp. So ce590]|uniref:hypothetical protein n=1 Tax=Sorangium sp. So ce590 TaxID=3133317 RepID=UPI003F632CE6
MTGFSLPASISYRMNVSASSFSVAIADTRSCRPPSTSALIALGHHEIHFQRIFPTTTRMALGDTTARTS